MTEPTVEWYVKINRALYSVTYLGAGAGWRLVQIEGRRPGATYDVRANGEGPVCNCPDGAHHRLCKHARALQALGGLSRG